MKIFVVIFALGAIVNIKAAEISEDEKKMIAEMREGCIAESGVDIAVLETAEKEMKLAPDEKFACFSACMLKKVGFITEEGKIDEDMVIAILTTKLPEDIVDTALTNCRNEVGKNDCETATKLIKCFVENKAYVMM